MIPRIFILLSLLLPLQMQAQTFQITATDETPCAGETVTLTIENNSASNWTVPASAFEVIGNTTGSTSIQLVCNVPGVYEISATDGTDQDAIQISVSDVIAYFEARAGSIERNKITAITVEQPEPYMSPFTFNWNFGDGTTLNDEPTLEDDYRSIKTHTYDLSGGDSVFTITLTVTNNAGCNDTHDTTITISNAIFIPNFFTPNAKTNNIFQISAADGTLLSITIFNRWGSIVYESEQPNTLIDWKGKLKDGSYVSSGVYYYVLTPENNNAMDKKMGFVHVYTSKKR